MKDDIPSKGRQTYLIPVKCQMIIHDSMIVNYRSRFSLRYWYQDENEHMTVTHLISISILGHAETCATSS